MEISDKKVFTFKFLAHGTHVSFEAAGSTREEAAETIKKILAFCMSELSTEFPSQEVPPAPKKNGKN